MLQPAAAVEVEVDWRRGLMVAGRKANLCLGGFGGLEEMR